MKMKTKLLLTVASLACLLSIGSSAPAHHEDSPAKREAQPEDDDYDYEEAIESTISEISQIVRSLSTIGNLFGGFRQPEKLETRERREAVPVYLNDEKIQAFGDRFDEYNTGNNVAENEDKFIFTAQQPDY